MGGAVELSGISSIGSEGGIPNSSIRSMQFMNQINGDLIGSRIPNTSLSMSVSRFDSPSPFGGGGMGGGGGGGGTGEFFPTMGRKI
eukprot:SAG11_NODE_17286_length_523_cov_0.523585_1_plen_86_part_00